MKFIYFVIVSFLVLSMPAFAWNQYTHRALWQTAIKDLDISICDKSQIKKITIQAPVLPDRGGPKNTHNCYEEFCPAMEEVNKLILKAEAKENFCEKLRILGVASHYYTDSKNPAHQQNIDMACHSKFEKAVDKFIKRGFISPVAVKCKKSKTTLTFNKNDFDNMVDGIKKDILNVALGE